MTSTPGFTPLPFSEADAAKAETIIRERAIPDIGRAVAAANRNAAAAQRRKVSAELMPATVDAIERRIFDEKHAGNKGMNARLLIAMGLKQIGIDVDAADLEADRRMR